MVVAPARQAVRVMGTAEAVTTAMVTPAASPPAVQTMPIVLPMSTALMGRTARVDAGRVRITVRVDSGVITTPARTDVKKVRAVVTIMTVLPVTTARMAVAPVAPTTATGAVDAVEPATEITAVPGRAMATPARMTGIRARMTCAPMVGAHTRTTQRRVMTGIRVPTMIPAPTAPALDQPRQQTATEVMAALVPATEITDVRGRVMVRAVMTLRAAPTMIPVPTAPALERRQALTAPEATAVMVSATGVMDARGRAMAIVAMTPMTAPTMIPAPVEAVPG